MRHVGLDKTDWGHLLAVYSTFLAEGAAIFFLFTRNLKYYGFLIGIPFHIYIGFTGYSFYIDFCTVSIALYTLFFPPGYYTKVEAFLSTRVDPLLKRDNFVMLALVVIICWYWSFVTGKSHLYYFYMPLFALYAALFYGSFLIWSWVRSLLQMVLLVPEPRYRINCSCVFLQWRKPVPRTQDRVSDCHVQ